MTNAYCLLEDVKTSLSGDVPNMGSSHDQSLVNKILEVSRDIDRKVAECRREPDELFSFLAEQLYGRQVVYLSATPAPTSGTFVLTYDGETSSPMDVASDGAAVQAALESVTAVGPGNVLVSGYVGGPWTVDLAGSLDGPRPTMTGSATTDVSGASVVVLPAIQGVSTIPSERRFSATPALYGRLLPIDDCVDVQEVRVYGDGGEYSRSMVVGSECQTYPLRGLPIEGLKSAVDWPEWPSTIGVVARWGNRLEIPADVREATVIEVIRSHLGALAGNDDRLGVTPFGRVVTARAFTSKFKELVTDYGKKLW